MSLATNPPVLSQKPADVRFSRTALFLIGSLLLLAVATVCSLKFGVRSISTADVLQALQGHADTTDQAAALKRIPRTVLGFLIGAALSVAGTTMQAVTRNPLADPGIFGVLSGASLAVVIGITYFSLSNATLTMAVAVLGSALAAAFVYSVGSLGRGGATPLKLALAGAATTAALSSLVSAVLLPRIDVMDKFRFWQIGGIGGAEWDRMTLALPFLLIGFGLCLFLAPGLNALALGDDVATSLGENVLRTRILSSLGAVILCGVATALAGPIAFVGLVVPHITRLIVGTDHRVLIPCSALAGAILIVFADTFGRVITRPSEIAVGIIMPLLGAPLFIWIIHRQKTREL
ncbi:FecCD family ABC transporter permease [Corynebacterium callunae]|uniref:FecCD family ABC transporter permease n=1 Tax=Corynebacterium callunae TaxID=1721 RepID=UPI0039820F49